MFYDVIKDIELCLLDSKQIFNAIKINYSDVYEKVLENDDFDFNICDDNGNNVLMYLLKYKKYELVSKYIDDSNININHQNNDGDTITHLLMSYNYPDIKEILEKIIKRDDFLINIKNNNNETILDKSINNKYLYATIKILSDKRFNNINLFSFKNLYETYIKSNEYGKYSKLNNFTLIFNNLKKKELMPTMSKLIKLLKKEELEIKEEFNSSKTECLDTIINYLIKETI